MRYIVLDLEATCWENEPEFQRANAEIIEIGAVAMADGISREHEFQFYIKPSKYPILTEYCTKLTGITQETVDKALPATDVLKLFVDSLTPAFLGSTMVSWGAYDWKKLKAEIETYTSLRFPFNTHINLKQSFAAYEGSRPKGLRRAVEALGWTFEGTQHSGIDDARNTAKIFRHLKSTAPYVLVPQRF